jgi:soluble lytic murein transglycosylase
MKPRTLILTLLMAMLLSGCGAGSALSRLQWATATPSVTVAPTLTPTATITPTPTPTPTPVPAARVALGDRALQDGDFSAALEEYQTAFRAAGGDVSGAEAFGPYKATPGAEASGPDKTTPGAEATQTAGAKTFGPDEATQTAGAEAFGSDKTTPDPQTQAAALLGAGRTYQLAGQLDQAVETLSRLIQDYPDADKIPQAYFALAQAFNAQERYAEAALAYSEYLNRRPGVIDGYVLELRGDARFAAQDYLNAAQDFRAALSQPGLLDSTFLAMKDARAYALAGDTTTALAKYDDLYAHTTNEYTKALIDLRKGQIYTALGQADQAQAVYLDAVNNYPTSYDSYSALVDLVDAGAPVDELSRGLVDYYAGQYGAALAAFNRYLQDKPADPATARYYSGLANRELGGFSGAINDWEKVIQNFPDHPFWDDAWEQKANTEWFDLDQYPQAVQTLLDFVAQAPAHPRAAEFLFDAAQIAERGSDLGQAAELWERVTNLYPSDERAERALFLSGLARYRQGDFAGAYLTLQRLTGIAQDRGERAKANFWSGKAQQKLGDPAAARTSWETAADLDPTGYYSERAVDLLQNRAPFSAPADYDLAYDAGREQVQAERWLASTFSLPDNTDFSGLGELASDPRLQRGAELWEVGLSSEARAEFEDLRQAVKDDPVQTYRLARYFSEIGLYRSAALAARQVLTLAGMSDAQTMNAPAYFNRLRFPIHYSDLIMPLAEKYKIHPLFIFSLVRQESLFESFVQSSASASGLMQIMPATGADIAKNLGWPPDYTSADLNRPVVNITLGIDYLNTQRNHFNDNLFAALAAYNGGPGNALEWLKLAGDDPDLFLEGIRYAETRDYVRSIYEIYNIYRRLYNRSP